MIGLDTNVLVRYIMQDDAKQSPKATRLIESLTTDEPGFVSVVSVVELGWVLSSSYGLTHEQVGLAFEALLRRSSVWLAVSFIASAPVNFALARYILRSPPGTPAFNAELGRMHLLVWPVIVVPSMIVLMVLFWKLLNGLAQLSGLTTDEILHAEKK